MTGEAKTSVDTALYLQEAQKLLEGGLPEGRSLWYIGYTSFLAFIFWLNGGLQAVVLVQIAFSGIAAACLYVLARTISRSEAAAFLSVLFYLLWIKIHLWNTFVYTESLFTSFCIISFTALVKSRHPWQYALSSLLLFYTFFIRPTGFSFYIGIACYTCSHIHFRQIGTATLIALAAGLLICSGLLLNKMLEAYILVESYAKAEIIYPNISLGLVPPSDLAIPSKTHSPLTRLLLFVMHNPVYFLKISLLKLGLFLGNIKPYFSWAHNLAIVLLLYPLYFFAVKGYRRLRNVSRERYFIASYVLAQTLTVTLTTENWDGRFLVSVLPFVFILSATGISSFIGKAKPEKSVLQTRNS